METYHRDKVVGCVTSGNDTVVTSFEVRFPRKKNTVGLFLDLGTLFVATVGHCSLFVPPWLLHFETTSKPPLDKHSSSAIIPNRMIRYFNPSFASCADLRP